VLAAYFDESFQQGKLFVAGGCLGRNDAWFHIETRWTALLKEYGLPYYHAAECEGGWKNFKKFRSDPDGLRTKEDDKKLSEIRLRFIEAATCAHDIAAFAVGIDIREFDEVCDTPKKRDAFGDTPFYYGYHLAMLSAADEVSSFLGGTTVAFIADRHAEYSHTMEEKHDALREANQRLAYNLGSISFESKEKYIALQVADLFVYEFKKQLEAELDGGVRQDRNELNLLKQAFTVAKISLCRRDCLEDHLKQHGLM
jgi:Protein of unknown function (DUF3800)